MIFEIFVQPQYRMGIVSRTQSNPDGTKIVQLLSRRSGLWIPVTQQQMSENDIPAECLFMVQETRSEVQEDENGF